MMDTVTKDVCCARVDTVTRTELGSACFGSPASLKGKLALFCQRWIKVKLHLVVLFLKGHCCCLYHQTVVLDLVSFFLLLQKSEVKQKSRVLSQNAPTHPTIHLTPLE